MHKFIFSYAAKLPDKAQMSEPWSDLMEEDRRHLNSLGLSLFNTINNKISMMRAKT